jgi:hypothetical protein
MSLKDCIARDIDRVFLNTNDYCDNLVIQIGTKKFNVIGSLQSNSVENNSGNGQPLQSDAWTLYIKYPMADDLEMTILSSGTRLTIDRKSYSVVSVSDEMGLATIQLQTRNGR